MGMSGQMHSLAAAPSREGPLVHSKQVSRRADLNFWRREKYLALPRTNLFVGAVNNPHYTASNDTVTGE